MPKQNNFLYATGLCVIFGLGLFVKDINAETKNKPIASPEQLKLEKAHRELSQPKKRKKALSSLWKLSKNSKRNKNDIKFRIGCHALSILAKTARLAVGYEVKSATLLPKNEKSLATKNSIDQKLFSYTLKNLQNFNEYKLISNWRYKKEDQNQYSNPCLRPFLELAYFNAIPSIKEFNNDDSLSLKEALKMLSYAEDHTQGIDKAETFYQLAELLRDLKEYERSETYLRDALSYGKAWFANKNLSSSEEAKFLPGFSDWLVLEKRIKNLLFLLSFDQLEEEYGESYAQYVKMRTYMDKEEWWQAFPLANKLKDKFPDSVYGEYGRLAWCKMLLENDMASKLRVKYLPSGIKELEKFISEKPYGLYRGEAWLELGKFYLEYQWDSKKALAYYQKAYNWFNTVKEQNDIIDLFAVPKNVSIISQEQGRISTLNKWRETKFRSIGPKEIINRKSTSWYVQENIKECLLLLGFLNFVEGKYEIAKKCYSNLPKNDPNIALLVKDEWPNTCWRLIASCNVEKMVFDKKQRAFLKGRNKLLCAYAEMKYLSERKKEAILLFREIIEDPQSSDNEKGLAYIGSTACMSINNKTEKYYLTARKLKLHPCVEEELIRRMMIFYSNSSDTIEKSLTMSKEYLLKFKKGKYIKEAQFRKGLAYVRMGQVAKAETQLNILEDEFPQYSSNKILERLIKKRKGL